MYTLEQLNLDGTRRVILAETTITHAKSCARMIGYRWKESDNIFGGYFVNDDGDVLEIH